MNYHTQKFVSYCQEFLVTEFQKRQERNPAYSVRAFARDIGVPKTSISEVINGLRCLSQANVDVLALSLNLDQETIKRLKNDLSLISDHGRELVGEDDFSLIKDWYYMAILSLAKLPHNESSADWISERLGLPIELASESLKKLMELGLLKEEKGKLIRTTMPLTTSVDIPSASIREHHKQSIEKAISALEEVPVELRDFTAVTYAICPKKIPEIKKMIHAFHRKLGKYIPEKEATEVYRLNIQFFPLTKPQYIESL